MANTQAERQFLDALVADSAVDFSAADRDAALARGIPIACIIKCVLKLIACGPTSTTCISEFVTCVLGCLGINRADTGNS